MKRGPGLDRMTMSSPASATSHKIEGGCVIQTIRGVGYVLCAAEAAT
jgi:hypothetical protein